MENIFILGAPDPEMEAIERLLRGLDKPYAYATVGGVRVHPGNAYQADGAVFPSGEKLVLEDYKDEPYHYAATLVECGLKDVERDEVTIIDHHRPGDPGYGRLPEDFLAASAIGQVIRDLIYWGDGYDAVDRLGWQTFQVPGNDHAALFRFIDGRWTITIVRGQDGREYDEADVPGCVAVIPSDLVLIAAADHCLAAAYRGRCLGVDPGVLFDWRVESRAMFQRRPVDAVVADINAAIMALRSAPRVEIAGVDVADLGDSTVPEAPEAAAWTGTPFLATVTERDGRRKQVLQAAPPEVISAWMASHPGSYGDPARGFAGRYL